MRQSIDVKLQSVLIDLYSNSGVLRAVVDVFRAVDDARN